MCPLESVRKSKWRLFDERKSALQGFQSPDAIREAHGSTHRRGSTLAMDAYVAPCEQAGCLTADDPTRWQSGARLLLWRLRHVRKACRGVRTCIRDDQALAGGQPRRSADRAMCLSIRRTRSRWPPLPITRARYTRPAIPGNSADVRALSVTPWGPGSTSKAISYRENRWRPRSARCRGAVSSATAKPLVGSKRQSAAKAAGAGRVRRARTNRKTASHVRSGVAPTRLQCLSI